jgi:hypothetical protein
MEKKSVVIVSIAALLIISLTFVSAGWFSDLFGITGRAVTSNSLVSHYKFDGNAQDVQENYHGMEYGDPDYIDGKSLQAIRLDGDDCVYLEGSLGTSSDLNFYNKDLTISSWVKFTGSGTIVARAKPHYVTYWLSVEGGKACARTYTGAHHAVCSGQMLSPATWYHITGVFDRINNQATVYVDGVSQASGALPDAPSSNDGKTKIGCRNYYGDMPFKGALDEVKIWNYALSSSEVFTEYNRFGLNESIVCHTSSDCGNPTIIEYCVGNSACTNTTSPSCVHPGTINSYCTILTGNETCVSCPNGCSGGSCLGGNVTVPVDRCPELTSAFLANLGLARQEASTFGQAFIDIEGEAMKVDDYIVVYSPGKPRILRLSSSIPGTSYSPSDYVRLVDYVNPNDYFEFRVGTGNSTFAQIDGYSYYMVIDRTGDDLTATAKLTWGNGAYYNDLGDEKDMFQCVVPLPSCGDGACAGGQEKGDVPELSAVSTSYNGYSYTVTVGIITDNSVFVGVEKGLSNITETRTLSEGQSAILSDLPVYVIDIDYSPVPNITSDVSLFLGEDARTCPADCGAESTEVYLVHDDNSPPADPDLLINVDSWLRNRYGPDKINSQHFKNSEVTKNMLDNKVTIFSYYKRVLIIVGENSAVQDYLVAVDAAQYLMNRSLTDKEIQVCDTRKSNEIITDDLKDYLCEPRICGDNVCSSGDDIDIQEGETTTFSYQGYDYSIRLAGVNENSVIVQVNDGVPEEIAKKQRAIIDDLPIYVMDIFYDAKVNTTNYAILYLGENDQSCPEDCSVGLCTLTSASWSHEVAVEGTPVQLTVEGTNCNGREMTFEIWEDDGIFPNDYIGTLTGFFDGTTWIAKHVEDQYASPEYFFIARVEGSNPVSSGNLNVGEGGGKIIIDTDNAVSARVLFDSDVYNTDERRFTYAVDGDRVSDSYLDVINLVDSGNFTIHVKEGEPAKVDEFIVRHNPAKDEGRILRVGSIPGTSYSASDYVRLTDVLNTDDYWDFKVALGNSTSLSMDGETYYMLIDRTGDDSTATARLTWGTGSAPGDTGAETRVFPKIKLENDAYIAFLTETDVVYGETVILPGFGDDPVNMDMSQHSGRIFSNGILWGVGFVSSGPVTTARISSIISPYCNFSYSEAPAILFINQRGSKQEIICTPLVKEGAAIKKPGIGDPVSNNTFYWVTDPYDFYRGYVVRGEDDSIVIKEKRPNEGGIVTIFYSKP